MYGAEGMWVPQQVPQLASELRAAGLKMDPARLADLTGDPLGAVISLGGCTASFVSPEGLIVTNHHCAFGSIQHNATPERDIITTGFLAKTKEEELPAAPGTRVWVTSKIEDVTDRMTGKLSAKLSDTDRAKTLDRREKDMVAECEKPGGVRCRVSSFFEGSQYLRTTQQEITDVRLVYAPARGVGEYGGEVDNFMWPRHTGDFSFYRAYVDGKPFRPAHWLKVSTEGVSDGDFVLVAGYPGRTFRYKTADEVRNYKEFVYPTSVRYYGDVMQILEKAGEKDKAVAIKNSARVKSLANTLKNYTSVNEGFTKNRILESRLEREAKMRYAIGSDPSLAKYATTLDEIARINAEERKTRERDAVLAWIAGAPSSSGFTYRSSPMLTQAFIAYRNSIERTKKDADRMTGYQERDVQRLAQGSERAQRLIEPGSDRAALRYFLEEAAKLPDTQRLEPVDKAVAEAGGIDKFLDQLYGGTKIASSEERVKMYKETTAQLTARNDSMIRFAAALLPLIQANETRDLGVTGAMSRLRPGYFEVLRKTTGANLYPDANSTLRVTFGNVEGYTPRDATHFTPQTTLSGVVQKDTGEEPFNSPKNLLAAARDRSKTAPYEDPQLRDVPVNFTSTVDTTGGNSGSPTLNAKGELVGLLFDGNYESIDSDFVFNPPMNRSIHVDVVYMLWVMDAVDGADHLIREMGLNPRL